MTAMISASGTLNSPSKASFVVHLQAESASLDFLYFCLTPILLPLLRKTQANSKFVITQNGITMLFFEKD